MCNFGEEPSKNVGNASSRLFKLTAGEKGKNKKE
jgi:hypothetical protein